MACFLWHFFCAISSTSTQHLTIFQRYFLKLFKKGMLTSSGGRIKRPHRVNRADANAKRNKKQSSSRGLKVRGTLTYDCLPYKVEMWFSRRDFSTAQLHVRHSSKLMSTDIFNASCPFFPQMNWMLRTFGPVSHKRYLCVLIEKITRIDLTAFRAILDHGKRTASYSRWR